MLFRLYQNLENQMTEVSHINYTYGRLAYSTIARSPTSSALSSGNNTRPSSRTDRTLRFAELSPEDVYVYESAPPSPKRRVLALPPPNPSDDSVISLGKWNGHMVPQQPTLEQPSIHDRNEPEEGSPEYIRRRFFPNAQKDDPNLAWMDISPTSPLSDASLSTLRFDLHANPIPSSVSLSLPTYLGLHHHAEGTHAGYTLDDIFLLSRSTVPAQRATMLGVLTGIARRLTKLKTGTIDGMEELVGKEEDLRRRILAAGLEAISERGNVGAHAIEVIWECIVGWYPNVANIEGVELDPLSRASIDILPLKYVLPQIATILTQGGVSLYSSAQLLSILHRLAQQSNAIATNIVSTPKLLRAVLQTFLLTPILSAESSSHLPDPLAIQLFHTLALSSRQNAQEIEEHVDCLLQYIAFLPSTSPYPPPLTIHLLISTLRLYVILASYGLHCHIAGTALSSFAQLEQYVISEACTSHPLVIAWANLVEVWTICAIDPHQTTPDHGILWSQIVGWGWNIGIAELNARFGTVKEDWSVWTALWRAQASWLEGSKVNAVKGGEAERLEFVNSVKSGFENGKEGIIVIDVVSTFRQELEKYELGNLDQLKSMSSYAALLTAVIRLWLACIAPHTGGVPSTPPFYLPFSRISELCAIFTAHPVWSLLSSPDSAFGYLNCRGFSGLLSYYLQLSRRLPDVSEDLWMAQAFTILLRLGSGDEDFASAVMVDVANQLTPEWAITRNIVVPPVLWERGVMSVLQPFIMNMIRPHADVIIGPIIPTPHSIKSATTQRLSSPSALRKVGLPLNRDWTLTPFDHLLRSGDSAVFKALPISWNASEVEITRASLFLTKITQEALRRFSLTHSILSREEAEFGCMKVFMLENGQPQNDSAEEVFRDGIVERFMEDILRPYVYGGPSRLIATVSSARHEDLEKVAARFLGASVPFYQYYTDFVALYDAISFTHPLFARLLLPPTSMRYASDYRKHLWCEFNHLIKNIRVLPEQVLSSDIKEYLYPIETDPQILGSYLKSLLQEGLQDFMRWVALHHVSANIWPDFQEDKEIVNEERASTLFKAVVIQGNVDVVREVVQYQQSRATELLLPPSCFDNPSEVVVSRLECVMRWMGQNTVDRLKGLLTS
jgi:RNA polymerase II-associated protein 1